VESLAGQGTSHGPHRSTRSSATRPRTAAVLWDGPGVSVGRPRPVLAAS